MFGYYTTDSTVFFMLTMYFLGIATMVALGASSLYMFFARRPQVGVALGAGPLIFLVIYGIKMGQDKRREYNPTSRPATSRPARPTTNPIYSSNTPSPVYSTNNPSAPDDDKYAPF